MAPHPLYPPKMRMQDRPEYGSVTEVPRETSMDEHARLLSRTAMETLEDVMYFGEKDSDRVKAAEAILDRGYGKAAQAIIQVPSTQRQQAILAAMTDEQLVAVIERKQLPAPPSQPLITVTARATKPQQLCDPAHEMYSGTEEPTSEIHPLLR